MSKQRNTLSKGSAHSSTKAKQAKKSGGSAPAHRRKRSASAMPAAPDAMNAAGQADTEVPPPPSPPAEPIPEDTFNPAVIEAQLLPALSPASSLAPLPLAGLTFAVSEDVDIQGTKTGFGVMDWAAHGPPAASTAAAAARAAGAGAACVAKTAMQPAGLDLVGANFGSPLNRTRVSGGGNTGAAVTVALQRAAFALATDALGQARVPAACCGLYAFRPSAGALGSPASTADGASKPPALAATAITALAREPALMLKLAQVLGAPGSANIRGEILQFVVAQDLFDLCAPELQPATLALKKAVIKWAGSDQAGAVQLVRFLANHIQGWEALVPGEPLAVGYAAGVGGGLAVDPFLEAAVVAAQALQAEDLHARAGPLEAAAGGLEVGPDIQGRTTASGVNPDGSAAVAPVSNGHGPAATLSEAAEPPVEGVDGHASGVGETSAGAQSVVSGAPVGEAPPTTEAEKAPTAPPDAPDAPKAEEEAPVASAALDPPQKPSLLPPRPSAAQLTAAKKLAADVADCLRATVKPDTILILPALPFAPPKRAGAEPLEHTMFAKLTQCFCAIPTLGGCPVLTAPVGRLRDGSPVAITLMAVQRFDQRLLAASQKLCPMIHESFQAVKEEITAMAQKQAQEEAAAGDEVPSGAGKAGGGSSPPGRPAANGAAAPAGAGADRSAAAAPPAVDPKRAEKAEKAKARGNELYVSGKHVEAMNEYTKAISLNPGCHVYYSNRAMACIKLFRFEQAEEDCNRALGFDLGDRDKVKALLRRATARDALQKYDGAESDLRAVLRIEPNNKQAREDLQALRQHKAQMAESREAALLLQLQAQAAAGVGLGGVAPDLPLGLPPGLEPSMFPPGFFGPDGELATAAGGGYEA